MAQLLWIGVCGVLFLVLLAVSLYTSSGPNPKGGYWPFIVGIGYYLVGVPPLCWLEKGQKVSVGRYRFVFCVSVFASFLSIVIMATPPISFQFTGRLFYLYLPIGSWVLFITWFYLLTRKYARANVFSKTYALVTMIGVNLGLLGLLFRWSWGISHS